MELVNYPLTQCFLPDIAPSSFDHGRVGCRNDPYVARQIL